MKIVYTVKETVKWILLPLTFPLALGLCGLGIVLTAIGLVVLTMFDDMARRCPTAFIKWLSRRRVSQAIPADS